MKIRLEYLELDKLIKKLNVQEEVFTHCVAELNTLIQSVPDSWDGKSADVYVEQFNNLKPSFEQARQIIQMFQHQIKETMSLVKAYLVKNKGVDVANIFWVLTIFHLAPLGLLIGEGIISLNQLPIQMLFVILQKTRKINF